MTKDSSLCPCFCISYNSLLLTLSVFLFEDIPVSLYRYSTNNRFHCLSSIQECFICSLFLKIDLAINRLCGRCFFSFRMQQTCALSLNFAILHEFCAYVMCFSLAAFMSFLVFGFQKFNFDFS